MPSGKNQLAIVAKGLKPDVIAAPKGLNIMPFAITGVVFDESSGMLTTFLNATPVSLSKATR